jgi:hypothetical protein
MKNHPKFKIPLALGSPRFTEHFPWDTEVLPYDPDLCEQSEYTITRIRGSRSKHIPERKPLFRLTFEETWYRRADGPFIDLTPCPLGSLPIGSKVLIHVPATRPQQVVRLLGLRHGILAFNPMGTVRTYCGDSDYIGTRETQETYFENHAMTCGQCLALQYVWVQFTILPYDDPREQPKPKKKKAKNTRSVYDWIRMKDPQDPPPRPLPARPPIPEHDPFEDFEVDRREEKLESRRESVRRFEESKRRTRER